MQQFDPNIPGLIQGDVTAVKVIDPASTFPPFEAGNRVLDRKKPFEIAVEWNVTGPLSPLWLFALRDSSWNVQAFAESLGGGPEILLARDDTVKPLFNVSDYSVTLNVAALALDEGDPGSNTSGIYKLVVSVFLDSPIGLPGFDMIGFNEGPIIQIEDPN
ncbi:hypothetical protein [Kribbella sp. NPDC049227]|uniref:hypothetical protein n=1 Tax=Kribbella sp. NPDC049227 TaxID=3364113 RepID=UPI0037160AEC